MRAIQRRQKTGLTLIEVMVVVVIIAVAAIGAMGFRFYCVRDAKRGDVQANAARYASMILENWKGKGGATDYNPADNDTANGDLTQFSSQFKIKSSTLGGPVAPYGFLGSYEINDLANNVFYYVTLSASTATVPTVLNATIEWRRNYGITGATAHTLSMTTYAD